MGLEFSEASRFQNLPLLTTASHRILTQTHMSTLSWVFLPLNIQMHGSPNLLCLEGVSPFSFLVTCKLKEQVYVKWTTSLTVQALFFFSFSSLWCKLIARITIFFPCRGITKENHSTAVSWFYIFSHFTCHIFFTKYQLAKRHQLFTIS